MQESNALDLKLVEALDAMLDSWLCGQDPESGISLGGIADFFSAKECTKSILWLDKQILELRSALGKEIPEYTQGFRHLSTLEIEHRISILETIKTQITNG